MPIRTVIDILQSPELYYLFRTHHNSDSAPEVLLLRTNCLSRMETRWKEMIFFFITSCLAPCQSDGNHVRVRRMSNTPSIRSTMHSIIRELAGCAKPIGTLLLSAGRVVTVSPDAFRTTSTKAAVSKALQRHFRVTCTSGTVLGSDKIRKVRQGRPLKFYKVSNSFDIGLQSPFHVGRVLKL